MLVEKLTREHLAGSFPLLHVGGSPGRALRSLGYLIHYLLERLRPALSAVLQGLPKQLGVVTQLLQQLFVLEQLFAPSFACLHT